MLKFRFKFKFKPNFKKLKINLRPKKKSFIELIKFKKRFRYIAISFCVVLAIFILRFVIINPKWGHSATLVGNVFTISDSLEGYFEDGYFKNFSDVILYDLRARDVVINGDYNNNGGCDSADNAHNKFEFSGDNHFKSLTVTNCAVIFHLPLAVVTDFNATTSELTPTGQKKKVSIEVDEDLYLKTGAKIDVTGRGYPGGTMVNNCYWNPALGSTHKYGYGPGGGAAVLGDFPTSFNAYGGGGASWGAGGLTACQNAGNPGSCSGDGRPQYSPSSARALGSQSGTVLYGSGGGAAKAGGSEDCSDPAVNGSAGGGYVKLTVGETLNMAGSAIIVADGKDSITDGSNTEGGSGGGGVIEITAKHYVRDPFVSSYSITAKGGYGNTDVSGMGSITNPGVDIGNVSANGGDSQRLSVSGGGGGRITIIDSSRPELTIRKDLVAVTSGINPYSLKVGNRIKVNIHVAGMMEGRSVTIKDEVPVSGSVGCTSNVVPSAGGTYDSATKSVTWAPYTPGPGERDTVPDASGNSIFNYDCTLQ